MSDAAFHLQIISPAQVLVDAYVPCAEIPGTEGDFGVLPGHAPFFSMIRPGVLTIHASDRTTQRFFAAAGYADVSPQGCTILSDHIHDLADITIDDAAEALNAARAAIGHAASDSEKASAQKLLEIAEALMLAVRG
jgi:F-type H+-transporting ATPase subunit epsilon